VPRDRILGSRPSGILTPAEDAASEQQKRNVGHHLDAYVSTLTGSAMHRENTRGTSGSDTAKLSTFPMYKTQVI
jgi:hypothetical protein